MTPLDRISQLTDENAHLRAEIERLENLTASGIHTCHADCQRPMCVLRRERDKALAELERVTAERDAARAEAIGKRDLVALRARVADLEAAESLHWITEEELRQSRARVAELVAALREEKRIRPEDFQQGDFRERALALARKQGGAA